MVKVRVSAFSISLDGFAAGPGQDLQHPFGVGADQIPAWLRQTQMFHEMIGQPGGATGVDNDVAKSSMENIGAWIMGRNMFGPIRGPWPDDSWKGWWGPNPPYHVPVFVLTHHARPSIEMEGGTVFHFVTDGIESALARAKQVAGARDIRIGGGASVIRQYLQARLLDEVRLAVAPVFVGAGENLFSGLNLPDLGYACVESATGENATHVRVMRK
ncbi:dihydrofolate reductase [Bradyrhizobium sp. KBS0727]|uniref:dihydrofolate reductase family protein n=1 Tax=unclassified Bradyrhizobium TaxID=2631580 RepID=UPI00110D7953|nr:MULTISPECIES: dihydrofolate reductase family protein [unclassified Bradyrhizobium]QDW40951.1 dihydrofolate reductase [Bradyrhizobium sp. KBS0725]QDW47557.1 dihydrofolate reductase [Bradyrhizobium sp. KBS0727]